MIYIDVYESGTPSIAALQGAVSAQHQLHGESDARARWQIWETLAEGVRFPVRTSACVPTSLATCPQEIFLIPPPPPHFKHPLA